MSVDLLTCLQALLPQVVAQVQQLLAGADLEGVTLPEPAPDLDDDTAESASRQLLAGVVLKKESLCALVLHLDAAYEKHYQEQVGGAL